MNVLITSLSGSTRDGFVRTLSYGELLAVFRLSDLVVSLGNCSGIWWATLKLFFDIKPCCNTHHQPITTTLTFIRNFTKLGLKVCLSSRPVVGVYANGQWRQAETQGAAFLAMFAPQLICYPLSWWASNRGWQQSVWDFACFLGLLLMAMLHCYWWASARSWKLLLFQPCSSAWWFSCVIVIASFFSRVCTYLLRCFVCMRKVDAIKGIAYHVQSEPMSLVLRCVILLHATACSCLYKVDVIINLNLGRWCWWVKQRKGTCFLMTLVDTFLLLLTPWYDSTT